MNSNNIPSGMMVPLNLDDIDEGEMVVEANDKLGDLVRELNRHFRRVGERTGTAKMTIAIEVAHWKGTENQLEIRRSIKTLLPVHKRSTFATMADDGTPIVQPGGSSTDDPNQLRIPLYDGKKATGEHIDPVTGEVVSDDPDTAGRITA